MEDGIGQSDDGAGGVAGDNGVVVGAGQPAHCVDIIGRHLAGRLAGGGDGSSGVAGDDGAVIGADQPAQEAFAGGDPSALDIASLDPAAGIAAHQAGDIVPAGHLGVEQAQRGHRAAEIANQSNIAVDSGVGLDEEVGDGVAVAVELAAESRRDAAKSSHAAGEGRPAGAAIPVEVGGVHFAAVVGVEVQVVEQFVAGAGGLVGGVAVAVVVGEGAAHAGEGGGVAGGIAGGVGAGGNAGGFGVHDAVAVEVVADGVELV